MQRSHLYTARLSQELSQDELANLVGVPARKIQRYEAGDSLPSPEILGRLAETLDVTPDYLLELVDDPHGHLAYEDLSWMERRLMDALDDPEKGPVLEFLMRMSGCLIEGNEEIPTTSMISLNKLPLN